MQDRDALRRLLRARRSRLRPAVRGHAEQRIVQHLAHSPLLVPGSRIAGYLATGSECDTDALLYLAWQRGCRIHLPRITDAAARRMCFAFDTGRYRRNRYGIGEPVGTAGIAAGRLSVIFLPLLGFTAGGDRLGSGAGFYDRALQFHRDRASGARPLLIGIGFACQQLDTLPPSSHDVPLDGVITENGLLDCHQEK
ncbi:MAG TPA: 5-formyltetrahydrofolate cyclo-ligase [Steroidobacteraceae bacterium]|nr:5-formyltetrahydrofolate cyclo-ligase [Steroidobacteraceae bacterium]